MRTTLVCFLLLAGCGGGAGTDIEASLVFAELSDAEIGRLVNAALGTDMFQAQASLDQFGATRSDPCPTVAIEGRVATITGGCTTVDGTEIAGSAVVTNPFGWDPIDDYDFGGPTVYEADSFSLVYGSFGQTFDGVVRMTDSLTSYDADITVTQLDTAVRSDLVYHCTDPSNPRCTINGGIDLIGTGGAHVTGTLTVDRATSQQTLDVTLQGADRLIVTRGARCIEWSIEGTDRAFTCP